MSEAPTNCLNCGAALHGTFCHDCGQKATAHHLGLHEVAHDATHEFLHLDGKILQTVKLLIFRPGFLTAEFIAGRRARYITPLRLYLTFSVIFFALSALAPANESIARMNMGARTAEDEKKADEIGKAVMTNLPRVMFILMPAYGLLTWLFYRRQQKYYVAHLYYAVHFHAFVFLLLSVVLLCRYLGPYGKHVGGVLFLAVFPWHYIALRRVFGGSRLSALAKGTAIGVCYWILLAAVMVALAFSMMRAAQTTSSNARPTIEASTLRSRYSHTASASG